MTTQVEFRAALLDAAQPIPDGLSDGAGLPAGRRYAVYRNNVAVSLRDALETGFPAVVSLIGAKNFGHVAGAFLRQHPPQSPLMMHYGAAFPDFLSGLEPLHKWGYLPDVARLELALRRAYHAADTSPIDPAALAALDEAALLQTRFTLAPSVQIVPSDWPLVSVWRFATKPDQPKPTATPESALVVRPEFDPEVLVLTPAAARFVQALHEAKTLEQAVDLAGEDLDLGATLNALLSHGAITVLT